MKLIFSFADIIVFCIPFSLCTLILFKKDKNINYISIYGVNHHLEMLKLCKENQM